MQLDRSQGIRKGKSWSSTRLSNERFRPGDRVRIRAVREHGSARLLHGLTGEVVAPHPIARRWYKLRLDANDVTAHVESSAPDDWLMNEHSSDELESGSSALAKMVRHYP